MTRSALLLIDIQNDYFPGGKHEVSGIETAAVNAARLLASARATGQPVIHVRHEITTQNPTFFQPGTPGADTHASVAPMAGETVILKHFPSSFRETGLDEHLRREGITALTLCGAMSQMCIDTTARAACDLGYSVTVAHDACAARSLHFDGIDLRAAQVHAAYMAALAGSFAKVEPTTEILGIRQGHSATGCP
ncbi:MAG: cysteine hydrolase [Rhodobacteraceae bacterium]|nr:MAG: cysteine hydrolase [Paracoccaceae bacterium]